MARNQPWSRESRLKSLSTASARQVLAGKDQRQPDRGVGDGSQNQRPAERGAHPNLLLGGRHPKHDSNEGDDAFGQGGAKRRQDRPGRLLADRKLASHPFYAVHEILAGEVDHDRRAQQQGHGHQQRIHQKPRGLDARAMDPAPSPNPRTNAGTNGLAKSNGPHAPWPKPSVLTRAPLKCEGGYSPKTPRS